MGKWLPPKVVAINAFMDLLKYIVPFFKVDTLQEWGWKSSSVELSIIQYVSYDFQSKQPSFTLLLLELTVFEVLDYRSQLAICSSHAIHGLGLIYQMDTRFIEELYEDDLQELDVFSGS